MWSSSPRGMRVTVCGVLVFVVGEGSKRTRNKWGASEVVEDVSGMMVMCLRGVSARAGVRETREWGKYEWRRVE